MDKSASGITEAMQKAHQIWYMECKEPVYVRVTSVARELVRYTLDLVGVKEVRWENRGTVRAGDYTFCYGKGNKNHQLERGFFVHHRTVSAVKRGQFLLVIAYHT